MRIFAFLAVLLLAVPSIASAESPVKVKMYKDPQCGCCESYADYLSQHGFKVKVVNTSDMDVMKLRYGVPDFLQSCHTMTVGGYVVEGHVPLAAIDRLLTEKPDIAGIAFPGMPQGAPGMSGVKEEPFSVFTISNEAPELFYSE